MACYITSTGSFLPGEPIDNDNVQAYLGTLDGEEDVRSKILRMNGIKKRHYALDRDQNATHDVYGLASESVARCLNGRDAASGVGYLSAGSTNTPLVAPGLASILHGDLGAEGLLPRPVEINSNSGICSSGAQAFINAYRAVGSGDHRSAVCVGVEQPSEILKSTVIRPPLDREEFGEDVKKSKWFMSVFLRVMLSDGGGAFLLQDRPATDGLSFKVNWTCSRSFAHETPLCMKLEGGSRLLSQDVEILSEHMRPCVRQTIQAAIDTTGDKLLDYRIVLPHLSSFFFRRYLLQVLQEFAPPGGQIDYWTNLEWAGNTGAASIYVMLDEYVKTHSLEDGDKVLLFIPESGQFNFVLISLTAVC
jgi:3-oxoacyl-[acyl-carrier-protein] synthase-3